MQVWISFGCALVALALYFRNVYSYFSRRGVKNLPPVPIAGNMANVLLKKEHPAKNLERMYNAFPGERFVGHYDFVRTAVVLRDLELIKQVGVKSFEKFPNHDFLTSDNVENFILRGLIALKDEEWKDMRCTLSPAFTSSKIRLMVPLMVEVADQVMRYLQEKIRNSESKYMDVDVNDLTTRYANDVIASCAFGCKVNSHKEENNEFYTRGKETATFSFYKLILSALQKSFPALSNFLTLEFVEPKPKKFFSDLVLGSMKEREAKNINRPDMIHLLMQAKNEWSDLDLIAQAVVFYVGGFDTISICLSFLLHELALNPDVQEKLFREIREYDEKNGGKFDYNSVQEMTYLDMVVSEGLRLWPPAPFTERYSSDDYNLGRPNDTAREDFIIRKGTTVNIPILAIHRDPQYFPDPEKFDPERFSKQNKHNIKPYSYLPFGLGPRKCIGSRFALCDVKVMVYHLLRSMKLSPAAKTQNPATYDPTIFNVKMLGGHWVRFRTRT